MNNVLRDKAWARRFARTSGDLGITRADPRYRFPIRIWTPTRVPQKARRLSVTVPQPINAGPRSDSAQPPPPVAASRAGSQHRPTPSHLSGLDSIEPAWGGSQHMPDESQLPCDPIEWAAKHGDAEAQALLASPNPATETEPF